MAEQRHVTLNMFRGVFLHMALVLVAQWKLAQVQHAADMVMA